MINQLFKFMLCILPPQCGKTFIAYNEILKVLKEQKQKSIHIVYTKNDLINNKQFAKRLENIDNDYGEGSICIFSSKKDGSKYKHIKTLLELKGLCSDIETIPSVIVACSNSKRFDDILNFIKWIDKNKNHPIEDIYLYHDELHAYINEKLRYQIEEIHNLTKVKKIIAFSATPDNIWIEKEKWEFIPLIYLENYNYDNYSGVNSMNFILIDDIIKTISNLNLLTVIERIIKLNPKILDKGTRTFIPGNKYCVSHFEIRNLIFKLNKDAIVILLNGKEKSLTFEYEEDKKPKMISITPKNQEINEIIADVIIKNNLEKRPYVITGHICVSMGQTLTNKILGTFTSAIFYHPNLNNDDSYQLFGRLAGRTKDWSTYTKTDIYSTSNFMNICKIMEECAIRLATDFNGKDATKEDYRKPQITEGLIELDNKKEDKDYKLFDNQEEAIEFAKLHLNTTFNKRISMDAPKELKEGDRNPSKDYLIKRMWGLSSKNKARMVITDENKWCIYWKPSLI